jgi:FtsP/CotA-like multicopper oxidase with cupredoxin domain
VDRRTFLSASGGTLLCSLAATKEWTREDVREADAAAARVRRPRGAPAGRDPVDALAFGTPQPAPGGTVRRHWIAARTVAWNIAPRRRDEWMDMPVRGPSRFRAFCYQPYGAGFAAPLAPPSMPGPILTAEVGDVLEVTVRNADERLGQAITMHPHGVRYTPDYDGSYLGDFTRAGGFIGPGEEFTYRWEARPDSVGVWPYHDHGPNHTLNSQRGLFGAIVVRPKGAPAPDVEHVLVQHALAPNITGLDRQWQCINGRAFAGNTPTLRAKVGQRVALHVFGADGAFHTFHVHGHRWEVPGGFADNVTFGPHEALTATWTEDNPGRWLYHCHVFSHQDAGMAGWLLVDP